MAKLAVKIPATTHAETDELGSTPKRPMGDVLSDLAERERRRRLLVARLRADSDDRAELRSMEGTPMDGLDDDPWIA